jgi:hypothetical protein
MTAVVQTAKIERVQPTPSRLEWPILVSFLFTFMFR